MGLPLLAALQIDVARPRELKTADLSLSGMLQLFYSDIDFLSHRDSLPIRIS
jgi:hypothetical protein